MRIGTRHRAEGHPAERLSRTSLSHEYWTVAQVVAHHTVGSCNLQSGDLFGCGTISGPTSEEAGALIELSEGGRKPLTLDNGEKRSFLNDGDSIIFRAGARSRTLRASASANFAAKSSSQHDRRGTSHPSTTVRIGGFAPVRCYAANGRSLQMSETKVPVGKIRTEVHGRVLKIIIDNAAKKNSFSPQMMTQMSDALTILHNTEEYWVGVICAEGSDFTAGLDMPKFFGPNAEKWGLKQGNIDVFGLANRCRKPIVTAVQGIVFTIGIEMMLAGDIVVAAEDCRFCQMEARRGIAPLGGAHFRFLTRAGWGDAMYHLFLCDEFDAQRAYKIGLVQEVVAAGKQIERAMEIAQLIANNAPIGIQVTKEAALKYIEGGEKAAIGYIPKIKDRVLNSEDAREGIQSFIERRAAVFQGR